MVVYISGKMRGLQDLGREHFARAEERLAEAGHVVINPAVLPLGLRSESYMPICLAMVDAADAIYMLEDWHDSPGAKLEHDYAVAQKKTVLFENHSHEK